MGGGAIVWKTLCKIVRDNVTYRPQVWHLARTEIKKSVHGTWLGYFWLIAKPIVYLCTFWFTLTIGLRVGRQLDNGVPYPVWLATGLFPWMYMATMIRSGSNVYKRYSYLVTKLRFPLPVISTFFSIAQMMIFALTLVVLFIAMIVLKTPFTIYLLQLPFLVVLMHVTFTIWSMFSSPLSAVSKDFHNFVKVMTMPTFWVSGIFFDVSRVHIPWIQAVLAFNPVTFFASAYRAAVCDRYWIWDKPQMLLSYLATLVVLLLLALGVQTKLGKVVPDVI